jgi:hypothetical protein
MIDNWPKTLEKNLTSYYNLWPKNTTEYLHGIYHNIWVEYALILYDKINFLFSWIRRTKRWPDKLEDLICKF